MASDAVNNAYVVGTTEGNLAGPRGGSDIFIRKYTPVGEVAWTRQFGTSGDDYAYSVAADGGGNVYVAGQFGTSSSFFLSKYSPTGSRSWTRHDLPDVMDLAVDLGGNVYMAGRATGANGVGSDMLIRKFGAGGGVLWTRRVHYSAREYGTAVAVSGNYVYLVGNYEWHEATREWKVAVTQYSAGGVRGWSRPYGLYGSDYAWDASTDGDGNLYFAGYRVGGPHPNYVGYVTKVSHDSNGPEQWTEYIGAPEGITAYTFAVLARTVRGGVIGRAGSARADRQHRHGGVRGGVYLRRPRGG